MDTHVYKPYTDTEFNRLDEIFGNLENPLIGPVGATFSTTHYSVYNQVSYDKDTHKKPVQIHIENRKESQEYIDRMRIIGNRLYHEERIEKERLEREKREERERMEREEREQRERERVELRMRERQEREDKIKDYQLYYVYSLYNRLRYP
jgi:phosphoketolase